MIISVSDKNNIIGIRYRDEKNKRVEKAVAFDDFKPYFYILATAKRPEEAVITHKYTKRKVKTKIHYELTNEKNLQGQELVKVTWSPSQPELSKTLRNLWPNTYEADVAYHYRYAIDNFTEFPNYELRKFYWDMEWVSDDHQHNGAITCICYYDSYDKFYYVYTWFPNSRDNDKQSKLTMSTFGEDEPGVVRVFDSEELMLLEFLFDIQDKDPDMLISWFGSKFDLPKLITRLKHNNLDPRGLSPFNDVKGVYFDVMEGTYKLTRTIENYSPIEQPIRGRLTLNLDLAFERQWNDAQKGTLPSLALDYISENILGDNKLVSEKFPDKNDFFNRGWLEDTETYIKYAYKDVELIVRIDEENFTSEAVLSLQRLLIAPFDACFYASNMGGIYFMRNADWKAPTGSKDVKVDYEGAMIYDPSSEGTNGLHLGVAAFDYAGLYPSMMIARNISWETKSDKPTEFGVNILTPRDFSDETVKDMRYFKTDKLGLLPRAVLELKELRNEYKKKMKEATTKEEYAKWNTNQMAVKRLMASFYGVVGYQGFAWADTDLAASITASAREAIREAAFIVRGLE